MNNRVELRDAGGGRVLLEGTAAAFRNWYSVEGRFRERVNPGAFARTLSEGADVMLLREHDRRGGVLARTKGPAGPTLHLEEDHVGLRVRATLDGEDPRARSLRSEAQRVGLEMSFAFRALDDSWSDDGKHRELNAVSLDGGDRSAWTGETSPRPRRGRTR